MNFILACEKESLVSAHYQMVGLLLLFSFSSLFYLGKVTSWLCWIRSGMNNCSPWLIRQKSIVAKSAGEPGLVVPRHRFVVDPCNFLLGC